MENRAYYYILLPTSDGQYIDFEVGLGQINAYNSIDKFLVFDTCTDDGDLRFIYVYTYESYEKHSVIDEFKKIASILGTEIKPKIIMLEELSHAQIQKLKIASRNIYADDTVFGMEETRLKVIPKDMFDKQLNQLIGFKEFKNLFLRLKCYINNIRTRGIKGTYNIALINNCDIDIEPFVYCLYDFYAQENIIVDNVIIYGGFDDALNTKRNTPHLCCVQYDWYLANGKNPFDPISLEAGFFNLSMRETIYITVMKRAEYQKAMQISGFKNLFIHSAELNELSTDEKINFIKREIEKCGFNGNMESFTNSGLLRLSSGEIRARIGKVVGEQLSLSCCNFNLSATDLEDNVQSNDAGRKELAELIGLEEVKRQIEQIAVFLNRRGKAAVPCMHMVFRGNPGTGKTTVARLVGRIFSEIGLLSNKNCFVETDREGLVGRFVGHTAVKTANKIEEAMGGVLFIDEAYSLGQDGSYGPEALATLVKRMEDYRKDFVCIMAGYTDEMEEMLDVNPGLRDRVQFYVDFPDYNVEELLEILKKYCKQNNYSLTVGAEAYLHSILKQIVAVKTKNFANARVIRKIFERIRMIQAIRTETNNIELADIEKVFLSKDMESLCFNSGKCNIGFKNNNL